MSEIKRCGVYERTHRGRVKCNKPATKCLVAGGFKNSYHYFCDEHVQGAIARAKLGWIPIVRIEDVGQEAE